MLQLWIYDDASDNPKALQDMVLAVWPEANLILGVERRGQAGARNALMTACGTEFGIMLDDDEYFLDATGLGAHLQQFPTQPTRAVILFKCISKANGNVSPSGIGVSQVVPTFMGGNVLFHIPSVLSVGGYRDFFIYGYEEPDLACRLIRSGFHIWFDPTIVVEHNQWYTPDEGRDYGEYDRLYARNSILLASMNMPLWLGLPIGIVRSVRRSLLHKRNYGIKLRGLLQGVYLTFSHWKERAPLSSANAINYWRFFRKYSRN